MSESIEVSQANELKDGTMKIALVQGQQVLLARVGDKYYAASNRCPHMGGNLSQGKLDGTIVTCPRHGSQFDLKDGSVVRWLKGSGLVAALGKALKSPRLLLTYNVKVEGSKILIDV